MYVLNLNSCNYGHLLKPNKGGSVEIRRTNCSTNIHRSLKYVGGPLPTLNIKAVHVWEFDFCYKNHFFI